MAVFKLIRSTPKAAVVNVKVQQYLRDELKNNVAPVAIKGFNRVISNWKNKPEFYHNIGVGNKQLRFLILTKGSDKTLQIWNMVNTTGAKRHPIIPKKSKFLYFKYGGKGSYIAKTGANPTRYGGSGKTNGVFIRSLGIEDHPGFAPRRFDKALAPAIKRIANNAIRRAIYKGTKTTIPV